MAMKDYSDEFKADAVTLYESTPGATYKSIAADLGINRATLRERVLRDRERRGDFEVHIDLSAVATDESASRPMNRVGEVPMCPLRLIRCERPGQGDSTVAQARGSPPSWPRQLRSEHGRNRVRGLAQPQPVPYGVPPEPVADVVP